MAEQPIKLEVVTPLALAVSEDVSEVTAPSVKGEFGVLEGHRPLLSALQTGPVRYVGKDGAHEAAVGAGFAEVGPDKVVLLVEKWVPAESIDVEDAREELAQAELRLKELEGQELTAEYEEARRDEKWAEVCLEVASRHRQI